jgi:outer membrane protein
MGRKIAVLGFVGAVMAVVCSGVTAYAAEAKLGYVDLRRAFYEYEKSKTYDKDLNAVTNTRSDERGTLVTAIRKLRDEAELLNEQARAAKQQELDAKITELNEFDKKTREELLTKKNDMFKEVIEDIQAIVINIGKAEGYDYILDSRNIMFAKEEYDLTEKVLAELNKPGAVIPKPAAEQAKP